jgi:hypothetical protein
MNCQIGHWLAQAVASITVKEPTNPDAARFALSMSISESWKNADHEIIEPSLLYLCQGRKLASALDVGCMATQASSSTSSVTPVMPYIPGFVSQRPGLIKNLAGNRNTIHA